MKNSLLKNVVYNFVYTGLNLFFPLITSPYISRVLGAQNLGEVNFATSIINWFLLFASFGTAAYGVREVAKKRDDGIALSKIFSEIVFINGVLTIIVSIFYLLLMINSDYFQEEIVLYLIMFLSIVFNMFQIDWFYQGIEEYGYITIRNAIIKIITLVTIFLFVNSEGDYVVYGLISVLSSGISGLLNYLHSKKFIRLSFKDIKPFRHFKSLSTFFIHTLTVSLYTNLDQTLLGFWISTEAVAYMSRSKVISNAAISVSTSITNVTLPRASYYLLHDHSRFNKLLEEVPKYILWITFPMMIGVLTLSSNIMLILGGVEFLPASKLLIVISPIIVLSPLSAFLQNQVLIPTGNEKIGLKCAMLSSLCSILLNFILISNIGYLGAGVSIVISEVIAVTSRYTIIKYHLKLPNVKIITKETTHYFFAAILMGIVVFFSLSIFDCQIIIQLIIGVTIGLIFYYLTLITIKDKLTTTMLEMISNKVSLLFAK